MSPTTPYAALILTLYALAGGASGSEQLDQLDDQQLDQPASEPDVGSENTTADRLSDGDVPEQITDEESKISFAAHAGGTFLAETDFDNDIGNFAYTRFNAGATITRKQSQSGKLSLSIDAGFIDYDINTLPASVAGDAASIGAEFGNVTTLSLIATYSDRTDEGTDWYISGGVLLAGEDGTDFNDTLDGMVSGGFLYPINNNLKLGIGVFVRTRLDDDVLVVPVPQIQYTIDDRWSINTKGASAQINYKATNTLNYGISAAYETTTFRLDSSHAFAPKGMATHQRVPVAFYADYAPNKTVTISGRIGTEFGGELEILNTSGSTVASQDIETGVFGSIEVSFQF